MLSPAQADNGAVRKVDFAARRNHEEQQSRSARLKLAGITIDPALVKPRVGNLRTSSCERRINSDLVAHAGVRRRAGPPKASHRPGSGGQHRTRSTRSRSGPQDTKPAVTIQSLFSPIQYRCHRKHKYTNEPIPEIPPPWTKLNPPSCRNPARTSTNSDSKTKWAANKYTQSTNAPVNTSPTSFQHSHPSLVLTSSTSNHDASASSELEEGEVIEQHKLTPSPILPVIDQLVPSTVHSETLQNYILEVKTAYLDAKRKRRDWEALREKFKNENFQALVSDYLADAQMRRDRGEITEGQFHLATEMVMSLLFGDQLVVEKDFKRAEVELEECYNFLQRLADNSGEGYSRLGLLEQRRRMARRREEDPFAEQSFERIASDSSSERGRDRRESSPEPLDNFWRPEQMTRPKRPSRELLTSREGLSFLRGYEERLRVSRALDQRVPFTRRHFNGKLTTFNEARATDTRGDSSLDRQLLQSSDPVIHPETDDYGSNPVLKIGDKPLDIATVGVTERGSAEATSNNLMSLKGFIEKCIDEDAAYRLQVDRVSRIAESQLTQALTTPQEKPFEQPRHLLFGNFPSAGRKKFDDEEDMTESDDDDFLTARRRSQISKSKHVRVRH